jgi:hypothetical protein
MRHWARLGVALVALALVATTAAAIGASSSGGVIGACVNKRTGALHLAGHRCGRRERAVSWNQPGLSGSPGANGANGKNGSNGQSPAVTVITRSGAGSVPYSSCFFVGPPNICSGIASSTVSCNVGEKATGGGYGQSTGAAQFQVSEDRFNTTHGTPTGWTVTAGATVTTGTPDTPPPAQYPIYVICAPS